MLKSRRQRAFWLQIVIGAGLLIACALSVSAVHRSLQSRGMTSGFGFLERSTGWEVGFSLIPATSMDSYGRFILVGLLNTLFLGLICLVLSTLIGVVLATMRISNNPVMSFIGTCYVEIMRNIPLILQVIFWYSIFIQLPPPRQAIIALGSIVLSSRGIFIPGLNIEPGVGPIAGMVLLAGLALTLVLALLPRLSLTARLVLPKLIAASLLGTVLLFCAVLWLGRLPDTSFVQVAELRGLNFNGGIRVSPELAALITGIGLYGGAFMGEIIRAGFLSVGKGQIEAAQALGLGPLRVLTRVRLPLALRMALPMLSNQYVWLLKATTLGIAVGFTDLFLIISTSINQSGQTLELIAILMVSFLVLNNALAAIMNLINRRIALRGTQIRL